MGRNIKEKNYINGYANFSERLFIVLISPVFFFVCYDLFFYWPWLFLGEFDEEIFYLMFYFTFSNVLILISFVYLIFKKKLRLYRAVEHKKNGHSISLKLAVLLVLSVVLVIYQLGGEISVDLSDVYTNHGERGAIFIFLHMIIIYSILFGLYRGGASKYIYYAAFFAIIFSMLLGGRSAAIVWCMILVYITASRVNLKIYKVYIAIFILFILFVAASIARGTISFEQQGVALEILDYNQTFTLAESVEYTKIHGARFDLFLKDVYDGFVPRSLNPDKNTSTAFTREVFPWVWEMTSYTSGFYANIIFVFGYYSVIISPVIVAFINIMFFKAVFSKRLRLRNFIYICFGVLPVLVVRGGIFEQRMILVFFMILLGAIIWSALNILISYKYVNSKSV